MFSVLASVIILTGALWILQEAQNFRQNTESARHFTESVVKDELLTNVLKIREHIRYEMERIEPEFTDEQKKLVSQSLALIDRLYQKHQQNPDRTDFTEVVTSLLLTFNAENTSRSFFLLDKTGTDRLDVLPSEFLLMKPYDLHRVQKTLLGTQSNNNDRILKFRTGSSPDMPETKIIYAGYYKPMGWTIGTVASLNLAVEKKKKELIDFIGSMKLRGGHYFFIGDWNGVSLSGPAKGKNMITLQDSNGKRIVQNLIEKAKEGGGFVEYVMPTLEGETPRRKISFVTGIREWKWYLGSGRFVYEIENRLATQKPLLKQQIQNSLIKIFFLLFWGAVILAISLHFVFQGLKKRILSFLERFEAAIESNIRIESDQVVFSEFKGFATSANRLIENRLALEAKRAQAEEALLRSEGRFLNMAAISPSGLFQMNTNGEITYHNNRFLEIMSIPESKTEGSAWIDGVYPEDRTGVVEAWQRSILTHKPFNRAYRIKNNKYTVKWVLCNAVPEYLNNDHIGFTGVLTDITTFKEEKAELIRSRNALEQLISKQTAELKEKNEALIVAKEATDKAVMVKNTFLANMRHELKTPLNAIIGMSEQTLKTELTAHQRSSVEIVQNASEYLLGIINDIIDYSEVNSGAYETRTTPLSLKSLILDLSENYREKAARKGVELDISISESVPDLILFDPYRMNQVLQKLLDNAVKYTEAGGIYVNVNSSLEKTDRSTLKIQVSDTGSGIDNTETIFDPFTQGNNDVNREYEGAGMGLAIVRGILESVGGNITVESHPGRGSVFHITLSVDHSEPIHQKPGRGSLQKEAALTESIPHKSFTGIAFPVDQKTESLLKSLASQLASHDYNADITVEELSETVGPNDTLLLLVRLIREFEYEEALGVVRRILGATEK